MNQPVAWDRIGGLSMVHVNPVIKKDFFGLHKPVFLSKKLPKDTGKASIYNCLLAPIDMSILQMLASHRVGAP